MREYIDFIKTEKIQNLLNFDKPKGFVGNTYFEGFLEAYIVDKSLDYTKLSLIRIINKEGKENYILNLNSENDSQTLKFNTFDGLKAYVDNNLKDYFYVEINRGNIQEALNLFDRNDVVIKYSGKNFKYESSFDEITNKIVEVIQTNNLTSKIIKDIEDNSTIVEMINKQGKELNIVIDNETNKIYSKTIDEGYKIDVKGKDINISINGETYKINTDKGVVLDNLLSKSKELER